MCVLEGPPLGPGGEDITWPDQVAPRGRKASSTRKIKPQTSNLFLFVTEATPGGTMGRLPISECTYLPTLMFWKVREICSQSAVMCSTKRGQETCEG